MSVSLQSSEFNADETNGPDIQMPQQLYFKPLPRMCDSLTNSLPNININEIYNEKTPIKLISRKTKTFKSKKPISLKDSILSFENVYPI